MIELDYTISETVCFNNGKIVEIDYEYYAEKLEEVRENMQSTRVKFEKSYKATFKTDDYEQLSSQLQIHRPVLSFSEFVQVVRPLMMGTYEQQEIRQAFDLLDRNRSRKIDSYKFLAFTSVIHPNMTQETIANCIRKVSRHGRDEINFEEFIDMVLDGIGRDIVCGHI